MPGLIGFSYIPYDFDDPALTALREATEGCPACILAAIRQSGNEPFMYGFDFTKECEKFWEYENKYNSSWAGVAY